MLVSSIGYFSDVVRSREANKTQAKPIVNKGLTNPPEYLSARRFIKFYNTLKSIFNKNNTPNKINLNA